MAIDGTTTEGTWPDDRLEVAERARARFAADLEAGGDPRIEDHLGGPDDPARGPTLRLLLIEELDHRRGRGSTIDPAGYRRRFPDCSAVVDAVLGVDGPTGAWDGAGSFGDPTTFGPHPGPGRYRVIRTHAWGGLGMVSLALDAALHREVALKEIRPEYADDPESRARFLREAEITGRLDHPGIVPVHAIGHHADGRPYYIMRFIRGENLQEAIRRLHDPERPGEGKGNGQGEDQDRGPDDSPPRPTLRELVGRLASACQTVAYAHHRGVLHRDIKPMNIMIGPFGETLVVDWGVAKPIGVPEPGSGPDAEGPLRPESGSGVTPTTFGARIGTTGYMSPEQAEGKLDELGPASDVYSLGVTLYALIVGRHPFGKVEWAEFLRRALEGDFPRPREANPDVPRPLEAICLKAMALRPVDRYATAGAMADDLERWRLREPVAAYPEPMLDRLARWARKHKAPIAAAAVLLVMTTIGLAGYAAIAARSNREIGEHRAETRKALWLSLDGLNGPELTYLPDSGPARLHLAENVLEFYSGVYAKRPDDLDVRHDLVHIHLTAANIDRSMGRYTPGRTHYISAVQIGKRLVEVAPRSDDYRLSLATSLVESGEQRRMSGRPAAAEKDLLQALQVLERPGGVPAGDDRSATVEAMAMIDLASTLFEVDRPAESAERASRAIERLAPKAEAVDARRIDRLLMIDARRARAEARRAGGDLPGALDDLKLAVGHARALGPPNTPDADARFLLSAVLGENARLLRLAGTPAESLRQADEAIAIMEELANKNRRIPFMQRQLAFARIARASALLALHRPGGDPGFLDRSRDDSSAALDLLAKLVKDRERLDPTLDHYEYHGLSGQALANLGRIAVARGDGKSARDFFERARAEHKRAIRANPKGPEDRKFLASLDEIATPPETDGRRDD